MEDLRLLAGTDQVEIVRISLDNMKKLTTDELGCLRGHLQVVIRDINDLIENQTPKNFLS